MRGRRCPQLASGELDQFLSSTFKLESAQFALEHCHGLSERERANVMLDMESGKQRIALQLRIKTDSWSYLPLRLASLGHFDQIKARQGMAACLAQFQQASRDRREHMHRITTTLLGPGASGRPFAVSVALPLAPCHVFDQTHIASMFHSIDVLGSLSLLR
jgi:hypothetical protein